MVKFGAYTSAINLGETDHASIAHAVGCKGVRVASIVSLKAEMKRALSDSGVTVLDVVTDPDAFPPITMFDGHL